MVSTCVIKKKSDRIDIIIPDRGKSEKIFGQCTTVVTQKNNSWLLSDYMIFIIIKYYRYWGRNRVQRK